MGTRFDRVGEPRWVITPGGGHRDNKALRDALGDQVEWAYAVPWLFRALASPTTGERMLAAPKPGDSIANATAYWTPLVHMLLYSLSWARPDRGLRWWYDMGKPTNDARLRLLSEVWRA